MRTRIRRVIASSRSATSSRRHLTARTLTPRMRGTSSCTNTSPRASLGFVIARHSFRFKLRRITASPAPTTPARGITISPGSSSWSSWRRRATTRRTTRQTHRQTYQLSHRRIPLRPEESLRRAAPRTDAWNIQQLRRFYPCNSKLFVHSLYLYFKFPEIIKSMRYLFIFWESSESSGARTHTNTEVGSCRGVETLSRVA